MSTDTKQLALPCACIGSCQIMLVAAWDQWQDDPAFIDISFYTQYGPNSLRHRLTQAWKVLTNDREAYIHDVVLYHDAITELQEFLGHALGATGSDS